MSEMKSYKIVFVNRKGKRSRPFGDFHSRRYAEALAARMSELSIRSRCYFESVCVRVKTPRIRDVGESFAP